MRKFVPVDEAFARWRQDPAFVAAYDALEEQFALASALIGARAQADMSQEDVAATMGMTKAAIIRFEGGKALPSTRTLKRFAEATNTRLRISFEPTPKSARKTA